MKNNNKCKTRVLFKASFCFALLLMVFLLPNKSFGATEDEYKYLSDQDINPTYVKVGWDTFRKDHVNGNGKISVKVEGVTVLETTPSTKNILDVALCACFPLESGMVRLCCCDFVNIYTKP